MSRTLNCYRIRDRYRFSKFKCFFYSDLLLGVCTIDISRIHFIFSFHKIYENTSCLGKVPATDFNFMGPQPAERINYKILFALRSVELGKTAL